MKLITLLSMVSSASVGPCHPYPGAVAQDVLKLISDHLNDDATEKLTSNKFFTISYQTASIVAKVEHGNQEITKDDMARAALTAVGSCAYNDFGSISGSYTRDDGVKVCYLYAGRENLCFSLPNLRKEYHNSGSSSCSFNKNNCTIVSKKAIKRRHSFSTISDESSSSSTSFFYYMGKWLNLNWLRLREQKLPNVYIPRSPEQYLAELRSYIAIINNVEIPIMVGSCWDSKSCMGTQQNSSQEYPKGTFIIDGEFHVISSVLIKVRRAVEKHSAILSIGRVTIKNHQLLDDLNLNVGHDIEAVSRVVLPVDRNHAPIHTRLLDPLHRQKLCSIQTSEGRVAGCVLYLCKDITVLPFMQTAPDSQCPYARVFVNGKLSLQKVKLLEDHPMHKEA
ncbi:hypothetical protein CONCODRAFT_15655 [Conidiobolus coronatus NRRL 28638]|uniref:Uncharacterized protein n=1 Tax=Conidiobolus coronatus (strain ATCC 28846 / CBS 209.66 / NRRL 28638) TaxID=796925 RepID=A0A137PDT4_CONC2|nr:hypothetical protein CONCODRAFT_15655 [Conidiobolus coronatus NRRL 28638]|eukprot:KXN73157.1 hypothetical protein CONCODRAFT_15655 [Conidiobolus coronatus NRRL 28638]